MVGIVEKSRAGKDVAAPVLLPLLTPVQFVSIRG